MVSPHENGGRGSGITSQCCGRPRVASKVCPWYSVPRRVALAATDCHPLSTRAVGTGFRFGKCFVNRNEGNLKTDRLGSEHPAFLAHTARLRFLFKSGLTLGITGLLIVSACSTRTVERLVDDHFKIPDWLSATIVLGSLLGSFVGCSIAGVCLRLASPRALKHWKKSRGLPDTLGERTGG